MDGLACMGMSTDHGWTYVDGLAWMGLCGWAQTCICVDVCVDLRAWMCGSRPDLRVRINPPVA